MTRYVLDLHDIDKTMPALVGGKGANLGELCKIEGISVPDGFCVSTEAYARVVGHAPALAGLLDRLSLLKVDDRAGIGALSGQIRGLIEAIAMLGDIREEIARHLSAHGEEDAYAVRSSATAEDLPGASFAGQQDTYLNIVGVDAILQHIGKCWASLFTERAVTYRIRGGIDHREVLLAVVVQKMVFPQASGIMFTADPVTSNRKVVSIDAGFGLGEALVGGLVNADTYKVRDGAITGKTVPAKKLAIHALPRGGTQAREVEPKEQKRQVLGDEQILQLAAMGRAIEAHFGNPQDIEWCLAGDAFYIVQSRPITTLYPVPEAKNDENHLYISVGHQQMMTDPFKPLGLSVWQQTAGRPMYVAGGRLFVDVAPDLASAEGRRILVSVLGKSDPLIKGALTTILERGDFIKPLPDKEEPSPVGPGAGGPPVSYETLKDYDPSIVTELIERSRASIEGAQERIKTKSGVDLIDFIEEDTGERRKGMSDPRSFGVIMTGMNAATWVNEKVEEWLGEKNAADTLAQSVPNNVTSEMGLALLDVADAIRPYPDVIEYLHHATDDSFWDGLAKVEGGQQARDAISAYLAKYGMRCTGEIDITRPRWSEKPTTVVPMILRNIKNVEPGGSKRRFEQGQQEALQKEEELLARLRQLPDGERKAEETKRMIGLIRSLSGYREYPKYAIVSRYFVYKQALLKEAERLVRGGVLRDKEDIYYLTLEELREVLRTNGVDYGIVAKRKDDYRLYEKLTPPRVLTSEGEVVTGAYNRENLPAGAIPGLAVSSGVVEGRARVILDMADAGLEEGDILVTPFTDPSWTPLFVSIKGLVTEVGGLMTHGAVIAREYGLPAVVGVENATKLLEDGQRIRVNGTEGYVEIL